MMVFRHGPVPSARRGGCGGFSFTVDAKEMNRLPVYHSSHAGVGRSLDLAGSVPRRRVFWTGTLVYDGEVYDHIRFRPRGGSGGMPWEEHVEVLISIAGMNSGPATTGDEKFSTSWTKLNLGASIQQGNFNHRGEQGMFEKVSGFDSSN